MSDDSTPAATKIERAADFFSLYANIAAFEPSAWDLKITFGQLEQGIGQEVIKQRVAITIPWMQAKLALYYLSLQVSAFELLAGKIPIRHDLVPTEPTMPEGDETSNPRGFALYELIKKHREEFIAFLAR